jgi:hypothetical protein
MVKKRHPHAYAYSPMMPLWTLIKARESFKRAKMLQISAFFTSKEFVNFY